MFGAIYLESAIYGGCDYNKKISNTFNGSGIHVGKQEHLGNVNRHNVVANNEINCKNVAMYGISHYNTVSNNNCHDNTDCGIMLEDSNHYNLVTDNYCHENEKDGIMLFKSDNNIVSDNYLYHNGYCGLWVRDESDGNTILGNIAGNNGWNLGDFFSFLLHFFMN